MARTPIKPIKNKKKYLKMIIRSSKSKYNVIGAYLKLMELNNKK